MTDLTEANDIIEQTVSVGSMVAAPHTRTSMFIGKVIKITPKRFKIEEINGKSIRPRVTYKDHGQVVCLDAIEESIFVLLKQNL